MIRAEARIKENKMFDNMCKLSRLEFEDMTYEQAIKLKQECQELKQKQEFFKNLIKYSDCIINKEDLDNEQKRR